jgi:uncharacterized protein with ParB-like and HNH nuclease domain
MTVTKVNFSELITVGRTTFSIPVYQRNYDWKESHCKKLFNDIEAIAGNDKSHFIGTIVCMASQNSNIAWREFTVIDGQQRITTVMLLLKAIYDSIDDDNIKKEICNSFLTNPFATEEKYRFKFKPVECDSLTYAHVIEGNNVVNRSSNLWEKYELFKLLIKNSTHSAKDLFEAIGKLEIVCIELKAEKENPQVIFESINSTGLRLTDGDLIRNFLLMNCVDQDTQTRLYKNYWVKIEKFCTPLYVPDFIRDYLTMKNGILVNKQEVYETFKKYAKDNFFGREQDMLAELYCYAEYYSICKFFKSDNSTLSQLLRQFHEINSQCAFPLLLWLFDKHYKQSTLSEEDLYEVIRILLSYQYRRSICKLPTNGLNKFYVVLLREIDESDNIPEKLLEILTNKVGNQAFPRNDIFRAAFSTSDLYRANNTQLAKYTLAMIENELNSKEKVELTKEITIEHIMPQTLNQDWKDELGHDFEQIHSQWLHTVGNLTLSGHNSQLSNESYLFKRKVYRESNFKLSRDAATAEYWNANTILSRAERLAQYALRIWSLPEKYNTPAIKSDTDYFAPYNIMDEISVTFTTPVSYIFDGEEFEVESWKDLYIGIVKRLYELEPSDFEKFVNDEIVNKRHLLVPNDSDDVLKLKNGKQLIPGYMTETNFSARDLLSFTQIAVRIYGKEDDVEFTFKPSSRFQSVTGETNT